MALEIRDFDTMVDNVLNRIVNADIGINNINPGSVIRTIIESIMAEIDIYNFNTDQVYNALGIDNATGEDLDNTVSILGVVRKPATYATCVLRFSRSTASDVDILIPYGTIVSTKQNNNGDVTEFIVTDNNAYLNIGDTYIDVNAQCSVSGVTHIPINALCIMPNPIIGIDTVTNQAEVNGGSNEESDDDLRSRAKLALSQLGKGTLNAIKSALLEIEGVRDVLMVDMSRGVATADAIVVTDNIPPSSELTEQINNVIDNVKAGGIDVDAVYPTIVTQDVSVTLTPSQDANTVGNAIISYFNTLKIAEKFIINQMERSVLNAINKSNVDITTTTPSSNVTITGTQIIRKGTITINGTVWVDE